MKFWKIKNITEDKGELLLYGDISEVSWWGDEVTPKQFAEDLKNLGNVSEIDVRINSMGGDVFAATTIASLLRANNAKINIYIDGMAASAATIVAMAGDKIFMPENSMMMIHDPLVGLMGYYNTKDFKEFTEVLDKIKESILVGYEAKTKKTKEELSQMMSDETWLTASEAVEHGFADEIISLTVDLDIENKGNSKFMIVNKLKFDISNYKNIPQITPISVDKENKNAHKCVKNIHFDIKNNKKEEKILDLKDLQEKYPDIYNQVYEKGVKDERERIKEIENIAPKGFENLVRKAKFENVISAEKLAMNIVKSQKNSGKKYLDEVEEDTEELEEIEPSEEETEEKKEEEVTNSLKNALKKIRNRR
ncbi:protease subunit of ATP-dependent Clp protease [Gottschalkia purinilytica]|uniref:ATP-dependent Clp protease proteolytic subunit n=1 Tax=Gottschalkia purinilytica TaxID=1503 RepID=A0A0L0WAS2_GOTPU|nr:head maturation protease, ClpP-related [Gottschalkia purinilytica]KNF08547.1 protease subunit of ATP-dependent Clp protease [Gottschalkia purinilytica]